MGHLKKMYFETMQGLEIQEILDVYTKRKAGLEESDINKDLENYPEKFRANYFKFAPRGYSTFEFRNVNEE